MKTKFVLASFVAALSGLSGLATSANAAPDLHLRVDVSAPRPPVIVVSDRDYGRSHDGDRSQRYDSDSRNSPYGRDWYDQQRELRDARNGHSASPGYWKEIVVKRWIPARWEIRYDRHGREVRTYRPGYMDYHTDRVWVSRGR